MLKIYNLMRCTISYHLSRLCRKTIFTSMPISLSIEPTTACNLRCPECPSGLRSFSRPTGNIKVDFYKKTIDEIKSFAIQLNFYFQGEPFIHPHFCEMVKYAHDNNIYTMTSTNAHFLSPKQCQEIIKSGLDELIISVDGTTQETYELYRREGDLNKVLEGARNIIEAKKIAKSKTPYLVFQFLVVKHNEHQIQEIQNMTKQYGIDELRLKTAQIYNFENGSNFIPEQEIYSRYKKREDGKYEIKSNLQNECWRMWQGCVITWDGRVVPCCFDKDASFVLGELSKNSFRSIWKGEKYDSFRDQLFISRSKIDICQNCTEGIKVFSDV
jgi:radical SAM protein with 4Fe4S-binding SPASM domain